MFYFSATAVATPAGGGTASVSPATTNVRGEHWNSTSATTTATFTATPNTGYNFLGWSTTADGAVVSTANPYALTITSTSTTSGSPTNTTRYAKFEQIPVATAITVTPSAISACMGDSRTVTYSLTPANAHDNVIVTSGNTGIATVSKSGTTITVTGVAAGSTTVTLSARDFSDAEVATATVAVTIMNRCAAPTIAGYDNATGKVTITPAANTTVYYTTDGNDPTDASTAYSTPFDLTEPTTVKAIAYRDGYCPSAVTSLAVAKVATPTIHISDAGVTFSGAAGATYYYSIDGGDPVTQWDGSTTVTGLSEGDVVKVMAKQAGMINSDVATQTYQVSSGVSGSQVILNDREDHSWSYYSDPECPIRSLSPADVKITYYGNGNGTVQTNNSDTPNTWGANATGVKVGIDADANTFVYYKTLERTDGSTAATPSGRCAYTTIANPFAVRPTYDSDATSKYRGFYAWRVKTLSGGTIHSAATGGTSYAVGSTINAETEIYFTPTSEYGMEVELEALWARAYVSTSGAENHNLGVERNFYVITASDNSDITAGSYPCTYTSIYPNGTTNGTTAATSVTVYKRSTFTASADSKIEYIRLNNNNNNTITAAGYNLTIGRGVTPYNGTYCAAIIRGMSGGSSTALNYTIRVESGAFENFYLVSSARQTYSNTVSAKAVFGCDYDRASNANNLLSIAPSGSSNHQTGQNAASGEIYGGSQMICSSASNKDNLTFDWLIKSGTFHEGQLGTASGGDESIYLGSSQSSSYMLQYIGKRRIIVEGGNLAGIAGGMNSATANAGDNYNNTTHTTQSADDYVVIRIKGGTLRSSVYGAAAFAGASGGRKFIFTGGDIAGWVAGGANGTRTDGGTLYGPTNLYIGGNTRVDCNGSTDVINRAVGGNVFGAGCGFGASSNSGQILNYGTTVVVADEAYVERGVYGGGSYGYTTNTSNIYILGGTVAGKNGGVNGTAYQASITGGVFGGACQNQGGTVNIYMDGGLVNGGVYGGSNATGTVTGPVTMQIDGGQVGDDADHTANIHGGGYGQNTVVTGNVDITLGASTTATDSVTVYGNVFGGSALGSVNGTSFDASKHTDVTMNKALINGNLFGGALGQASPLITAPVNGLITVTINGGRVNGNVYGGGDASAYSPSRDYPVVNMSGGTVVNLFGGGKGSTAAVTGNPKVTLSGDAHVTGNVYGGGDAARVAGQTSVILN